MKVLILSDINSAHTRKWVLGLQQQGISVAVFSFTAPASDWSSANKVILLGPSAKGKQNESNSVLSKAGYIRLVPDLKRAVSEFKPDILHAHYASSYGFIGALSGFHPFVISAWGSDLMEFPLKSILNRKIIKYNLKKADQILATSDVLVRTIARYSEKLVAKIPFGINTEQFRPTGAPGMFPPGAIVIGTVKSLERIYGTDILLKAFKQVLEKNPFKELHLLIVGGGSREEEYRALSWKLGINEKVVFTGRVEHDEVVYYHNMIDVFVNVSRNESFGVSVIESSACMKPVVVSDVGGLPEVVIEGETGFHVPAEDAEQTAKAIDRLVNDPPLRKKMGEAGRIFVRENFSFAKNVSDTIRIYEQLLSKKNRQ